MSHPPFRIGDVEVSTVCEGWAPLPLSDEAPGHNVDWHARVAHPWAFADDKHWPWHVHAFLLRTPAGDVLVDTGVGASGRSSRGPRKLRTHGRTSMRKPSVTSC